MNKMITIESKEFGSIRVIDVDGKAWGGEKK